MACYIVTGKTPSDSERLMIFTKDGTRQSKIFDNSCLGTGSSIHVFMATCFRRSFSSDSDTGVKQSKFLHSVASKL